MRQPFKCRDSPPRKDQPVRRRLRLPARERGQGVESGLVVCYEPFLSPLNPVSSPCSFSLNLFRKQHVDVRRTVDGSSGWARYAVCLSILISSHSSYCPAGKSGKCDEASQLVDLERTQWRPRYVGPSAPDPMSGCFLEHPINLQHDLAAGTLL